MTIPNCGAYAHEVGSGVQGGTLTSGSWQTAPWTVTKKENPEGANRLTANVFTLAAGRWWVNCERVGVAVSAHKIRIINDAGTEVLTGSSEYSYISALRSNLTILSGVITVLAGHETYTVQQRCSTTNADDGMGVPCSFGTECYGNIEFTYLGP